MRPACPTGASEKHIGRGRHDAAADSAPPRVLEPYFFDENDCAYIDDGEVDCGPSVPPEMQPEDDVSGVIEWRTLLGFVGPYCLATLDAPDVVLIRESITTSSKGAWKAWGLVRNETSDPSGADVTASLLGPDGSILDKVSGHVLVDPLRPGEPGPFALEADVPYAEVADVAWSVTATPPGNDLVRDFQVLTLWELPLAEGDRP